MSRRNSSRRAKGKRYRIGRASVYFRKPSWWIYYAEESHECFEALKGLEDSPPPDLEEYLQGQARDFRRRARERE